MIRIAPRRTAAPAARRARGVSLIEMIIVVVLIAVMSVLAAGAMSGGFKGMQLRSAAKEVASQLRFTRTRAIATGQTQRFVIQPRTHAWQAPDGRHGSIPAEIGLSFIGARQTRPSPDEGAILFFADGASTGGRVRLVRDTAAFNIDVAWLTGEVKLDRSEAR
ncbi:type II secretion system protein GspH [Lysobacter sp. TY2-98]|uniref:type II secretion system protein XpsH n=1 Tax=Lysobacter sp. TY2-98 TaxID=2290922 RepID=UPI000E1FC5E0|nr:GspH/FimT family pseudopilin [Lysobacter sp. TY2-98]AXK70932.1 type II secretion system protein GspH [Lysobacter sp. TY2-98]